MIPPPPTSTLFPYTTLFRSHGRPGFTDPGRFDSVGRFRCASQVQLRKRPTESKRSEEHTSELQSRRDLVCRLLLEKKKKKKIKNNEEHTTHSNKKYDYDLNI